MSRLEHVLNVGKLYRDPSVRNANLDFAGRAFHYTHNFVRTWWLYNRFDYTIVTRRDTFGIRGGRKESLIGEFHYERKVIEEFLRKMISFDRPMPSVAKMQSVTDELVFEFWRMPPWNERDPRTKALTYPKDLEKISIRLFSELKKYAHGKPSKFDA